MKIKVEIIKNYPSWKQHKFITKSFVKKVVANIINRYNNLKITQQLEVVILLTDDSQMQNLNQQFRGKNKTTNVLSFPDIVLDFRHLLEFTPDLYYMYLGDIAFGYETIINEARSQNKTFKDHFTHLLVHSILHLLGFDHQNDEEADVMEKLEAEILSGFAIDSPY
ncbi:rRNA maturation RNase YbeY [Candidatus Tisiphia endosymbiont of Nemotelus uliginosus]|uniref:rRNA maturation RNase YbeY n=1 Tax=Candidatus Tisiphia endosymbiont of Nemotelus uliginosus TaxID=3077926 RepID=UPI0035C93CE6